MNNKYGDKRLRLGNQFTAKYLHILLKETVYEARSRVGFFMFWFDLCASSPWEDLSSPVVCIRVQRHSDVGSKPLLVQKRKLRSGEMTWVGKGVAVHLEEISSSWKRKECDRGEVKNKYEDASPWSFISLLTGRKKFLPPLIKTHINTDQWTSGWADFYLGRDKREEIFHWV